MIFKNPALSSPVKVHDQANLGHAQSAPEPSHQEWVDGESIRAYMTTQRSTHLIALLVMPVIFSMLYGHVYPPGLVAWFVISILLTAYRWRYTKHYMRHLADADTYAQLQFRAQHAWTWPLASGLWGALVWLFFTQAPLFNQFVCWVTLASIGVFSATGYAAHLKTMKQFINTMLIVMLCGMAWRYVVSADAAVESMIYSILPLEVIFWVLLMLTGSRLNEAHIQRLDLIKGNLELINSLKEQTLRANQAVETKNRFLASAAHDIRQPVLALGLYASLLKNEPGMATDLTDKIGSATKSVIDMFDSLFDLARLESGQLNINSRTIDVPGLLRELELQYKPAADAKHLKLRLRTRQLEIQTDHQLLKRILGNLLMNAIKFTNHGGVLLACRPTLRGVRFEVWDTGVGIPADQQVAVFREFYKSPVHMGTSEGFGLGLSIVARLCEPLGLDFSMHSRLGRGSVFCIEVPMPV